jgi:hypothetical protein
MKNQKKGTRQKRNLSRVVVHGGVSVRVEKEAGPS